MCKKRIGVIFGGRSEEHQVSLVSAAAVVKALDSEKFVPIYIGITRDGRWKRYCEEAEKQIIAASIEKGTWEKNAVDFEPAELQETVDFVLPMLHGPYGEDGCIQGFLETLGIPYGGCGVLASAVCMDKQIFKQLMKEKNLPVCSHIVFTRKEIIRNCAKAAARAIRDIGLPCFVKPANMGSSVGISKARSEAELFAALKTACLYDDKVIAEKYIRGRELEIAALGDEDPEFTAIGEIIPSKEFYDFTAKYATGHESEHAAERKSELIIPACIEHDTSHKIKAMAREAYKAIGGWGFCRIDFFLEKDTDDIYINEINTIPGFTNQSMFPLLWQHEGMNMRQIIERIIDLGYERDHIRNNRKTTI